MAWISWNEVLLPFRHKPQGVLGSDGRTLEEKFPHFFYEISDELATRLDEAHKVLEAIAEEISALKGS